MKKLRPDTKYTIQQTMLTFVLDLVTSYDYGENLCQVSLNSLDECLSYRPDTKYIPSIRQC